MKRTILGIDPGSHFLGVGCVEKIGNKLKLIQVEVIDAPHKDEFYLRLEKINDDFETLLDKLQPTEVAIEDTFFGKNAKSAFRLGLAKGVVVAACLRRKIKIYEYAPTQIKLAVTGYGRAAKEQVKKMTELTLETRIEGRLDATDALAVAICHAHTKQRDFNVGT